MEGTLPIRGEYKSLLGMGSNSQHLKFRTNVRSVIGVLLLLQHLVPSAPSAVTIVAELNVEVSSVNNPDVSSKT